jgi:OHCU decarboxylase
LTDDRGVVITTHADRSIDWFNALSEGEARRQLATCLDVPRWIDEVLSKRPYADTSALIETARASATALTEDEVEAALARHPRIGEQAGAGHDAEFSSNEQAGVDRSDVDLARSLAVGNAEYERRFDRVFLIRAAGRSAEEILAELDRRLANTDAAEFAEVVEQLGQIAILRLEEVIKR